MLDVDSEEGRHHFYVNLVSQAITGVRPNSLRRLLAVERIIAYETEEAHGPAYQRWQESSSPNERFVDSLDTEGFYLLRESATDLVSEDDAEFLFGISKRTAQDYVKSLRMLYLWR